MILKIRNAVFSAAAFLTIVFCLPSAAAPHSSGNPLTLDDLQPASLECTFEVAGFPESTATYDAANQTVETVTGSPPSTQTFQNVMIISGVPPYGNDGLAYIAFGDVPLFSVTIVNTTGRHPHDSGQEILATWQSAPGGPKDVLNAGVCHVIEACTCRPHGDDKKGEDEGDRDPDRQGDINWALHCQKHLEHWCRNR
jgi:hypothetical protein